MPVRAAVQVVATWRDDKDSWTEVWPRAIVRGRVGCGVGITELKNSQPRIQANYGIWRRSL